MSPPKIGLQLGKALLLILLTSVFSFARAESERQYVFDIPQKRLDKALVDFVRQTRLPMLFPVAKFKEKYSKALLGTYTSQHALEILLQESGFEAVLSDEGIMTIVPSSTLKANVNPKLTELASIESADDGEALAEVLVTGIKFSTGESTEIKKNADQLIDVITAEDVGKFPDDNVGEALQRITGVQVIRDEAGQISDFQVRGISQNRIEFNGRTPTAGEGEGRNPVLADIPAELIYSLELVKSPSADMIEGSLGATVNLKTAKPFDYKKPLFKLNLMEKYGDNIETRYGNYSAIVSNSWTNDRFGQFGFLANIIYNSNKVAGDIVRINGWQSRCQSYALTRPDGSFLRSSGAVEGNCERISEEIPGADTLFIYSPYSFVNLQYEEERARASINTTFQWRPNGNSEYLLDITYISKEDLQVRDTLRINAKQGRNFIYPSIFEGLPHGTVVDAYSDVMLLDHDIFINEDGSVSNSGSEAVRPLVSANLTNAFVESISGQGSILETDRLTMALKGKWNFEGGRISSEFNYSKSYHERHYLAHTFSRWEGNVNNQTDERLRVGDGEAFRAAGSDARINLGGSSIDGIQWLGHDLTDPRYFRLGNVQDDGWVHEPKELALKVDVDYDIDYGSWNLFEFGVRLSESVQARTQRFNFRCERNYSYSSNGPNESSFQEGDRACEDPSVSLLDFLVANPDAFKLVGGFFDIVDGEYPGPWLQLDPALRFENYGRWQEVYGFNDAEATGTGSGFQERVPDERYKITEQTLASYVKLNFSDELTDELLLRGNIGVRSVHTLAKYQARSGGASVNIDDVQENSDLEFLPSANIIFEYDDDLMFRLAAAKVMVRPQFSHLKPVGSFNQFTGCSFYDDRNRTGFAIGPIPDPDSNEDVQSNQRAQLQAIADYDPSSQPCPGIRNENDNIIGNPDLSPFTAYNYDLSLEQYWGFSNYASAGFFYRDVDADIVTRRVIYYAPVDVASQSPGAAIEGVELWRVNRVENGEESVRKGVELSYTQFMDFMPSPLDGLGVSLNYTYADGTRPKARYIGPNGDIRDANGDLYTKDSPGALLLDPDSFRPVNNLSRNSYNVSIFYEKHAVSARLSYNYRDRFHISDGRYQDDTDRLDFSSSFTLNDNFKLSFNVQNILRSITYQYDHDPAITREVGYSDVIYSLGLSYTY